MRPLFTLILLLLLSRTAIQAQNPELWINGIQVTTENHNDILGDGTVNFDQPSLTLTFTHTALQADKGNPIVESRVAGLTICFRDSCTLESGGTTCFILHSPTTLTSDETCSAIMGHGHTIFRSQCNLRFVGVRLSTSDAPFFRPVSSTCYILTFDRAHISHTYHGSQSSIDKVSALIMTDSHFHSPIDTYFDPNVRSMRYGLGLPLQDFVIIPDDEDRLHQVTTTTNASPLYDLLGRPVSPRDAKRKAFYLKSRK